MSDLISQLHQQNSISPVPPYAVPAQSQLIDVAFRCLAKGWYVFPLGERSKIPDGALAPNGFNSSSNDLNQIYEWWTKSPNANIGIDLGRSNLTVLDFDNGKPPAALELPPTLQINTSRGTHVYLVGTSKQGDMYFGGQHIGEIKSAGGYVLSPLSVHPSGAIYSIAVQASICPIPEGLIDRLRPERKPPPSINGDKIPHGSHDRELTRIAGKLRHDGSGTECHRECSHRGLRKALRELWQRLQRDVRKDCQVSLSLPGRNGLDCLLQWRSGFRVSDPDY